MFQEKKKGQKRGCPAKKGGGRGAGLLIVGPQFARKLHRKGNERSGKEKRYGGRKEGGRKKSRFRCLGGGGISKGIT